MDRFTEIPAAIQKSLVLESPLVVPGTSGISLEWIDIASPYRVYLCLWFDLTSAFAMRREFRFERRRDGGIRQVSLWDGVVTTSSHFVAGQLDEFEGYGVWELVDRCPPEDVLDGEWYVIRIEKLGQNNTAHIYSPNHWGDRKLIQLKKAIDRLLIRPRKYFERRRG